MKWEEYEDTMRAVRVRRLHHLQVESRADAESTTAMRVLEKARGVWERKAQAVRRQATRSGGGAFPNPFCISAATRE